MNYFVTGATGFIGKQLLPLLLERDGEVAILVRPGSRARFASLLERYDPEGKRLRAVYGDIAKEKCDLSDADRKSLHGAVFFHLAAVYDLTASAEVAERSNILGTSNVVAVANECGAACLHYVSSIAVAGRFKGEFTEAMFDQGQELDHPYFQTKFEAEKIVREDAKVPIRIYRPGIVIGSSETGEADRIDGPYYAFKLIQKMRDAFPQWMPFVGPEGGPLNLVPVDFVAKAMDHIAHQPELDGRTFHLVDSNPLSLGDTLNTFCRAAHAPEFALRFDRRMLKLFPKGAVNAVSSLPVVTRTKGHVLDAFGIPESVLRYMDYPAKFTATETQKALEGTHIAVPPLHDYAWKVWDWWERHLDPELPTPKNIRRVIENKVVLITGASSGIGRAVARQLGTSGGIIVGVARSEEKLQQMKEETESLGAKVHLYPTDLSDPEACTALIGTVTRDLGHIDVLINNAGRSIRRSVLQELDRFHDFERTMKLNYFGALALILAVIPQMRERKDGHIINISSIGAQSFPPRFAAYVASKAALVGFSKCLAPEVAEDNIAVTNIHMPLVRTPMIEPTGMYKNFPTISADEAAEMVVQAIIRRPQEVSTRLGKFGELSSAAMPGLHQLIMAAAYHMFPDTAKKEGGAADESETPVSPEAYAMSMLMRGIHL